MKRRAQAGASGLPIKAVYSVGELASAGGIERRHLRRLLSGAGVEFMMLGKGYFVSLADLEHKVRPLWEGIQAAQTIARGIR